MTAAISSEQLSLGTNTKVKRFDDIRGLLPSVDNPTPLVRINRVTPQTSLESYLKLEWLNPFGSVKDRTAAYLLEGMMERGDLDGRDIVEASSGNTAIALAALAALIDKRLTVTIPDGVPEEKKVMLRMLGAEVWETPDDLCPVDHPKDGAIALARSLAASEGGTRFAMANQYENEDNVRAHYETTGPEIWRQTEGRVRFFVAGLGTTGTVTGTGRYLKERDPSIQVIAIEPQRGHRLPGLKSFQEAKEPGILDWSVIDDVIQVDDEDAYQVTKRLHREEGLIVGPSTGAVVHAINQLPESAAGVAVGISPDSGAKYASYFGDVLGTDGLPQL
ncbi:MAG: cysteine synthase family protein [Acidimicrobiia bacterium]|nr:cysteine synthase family protein [Acidimicrobiia bacterium]MDX2466195.1 cysteine synthase family protein [Acidimicrobiia bacterium]